MEKLGTEALCEMVNIAPGSESQRVVQMLVDQAASAEARPRACAFHGITRLLLVKTVKFTEEWHVRRRQPSNMGGGF
jgi:hypothetical protein